MKQQNQPPAPQNPLSRTFLGVATGLLASLHGRDSSQLRAPPRGDASDQAETTNRSIRSLAPLGGFPANALHETRGTRFACGACRRIGMESVAPKRVCVCLVGVGRVLLCRAGVSVGALPPRSTCPPLRRCRLPSRRPPVFSLTEGSCDCARSEDGPRIRCWQVMSLQRTRPH